MRSESKLAVYSSWSADGIDGHHGIRLDDHWGPGGGDSRYPRGGERRGGGRCPHQPCMLPNI